MKFLVISDNPDLSVLSNNDSFYFASPGTKENLSDYDCIVSDGDFVNGHVGHIVGGNEWAYKLSSSQTFCDKAFKTFKIKAPKKYNFQNIDQALEFLDGQRTLYNIHLSSEDVSPNSYSHMVEYLKFRKSATKYIGALSLKEKIKGQSIKTELWFSKGREVAYPISIISNDDSTVMYPYPTREPKIIQQSLKKIRPFLRRVEYTGPLSIDGVIRAGKFYGLSMSCSIDPQRLIALGKMMDQSIPEFLFRISIGDHSPMKLKKGYVFSSVIKSGHGGLLIHGNAESQNIDFVNAYKKDGFLRSDGGTIAYLTGVSESLQDAESQCIQASKSLNIFNADKPKKRQSFVFDKIINNVKNNNYECPPFEFQGHDDSKVVYLSGNNAVG